MIPVEVDDELGTHFADLGRDAFDAPLFDDVVDRHRAADGAPRIRLPADSVLVGTVAPRSRPAGLVLHVGRCGSTLLCNLLTTSDAWVALKEPEFVNSLLLKLADEPDPVTQERVGALVALLLCSLAYGTRFDADGRERRCVVKLSSWNAMFTERFVGRLGPIPLVVVTRDPLATVGSFLDDPPHWYGSRPAPSNVDRTQAASLFAEAWSRTIDTTLEFPARQTLFVDYTELVEHPTEVLGTVRRHLGDLHFDAGATSLAEVTARYSKGARGERFAPNGRHRRAALPEDVRELVTSITARSWRRLGERMPSAGRR